MISAECVFSYKMWVLRENINYYSRALFHKFSSSTALQMALGDSYVFAYNKILIHSFIRFLLRRIVRGAGLGGREKRKKANAGVFMLKIKCS